TLPLLSATNLRLFCRWAISRRQWRETVLLDLLTVLKASVIASLACVGVLFLWTGLRGYSRAVFVLDWGLTYGLLAGMRVSVRTLEEYFWSLRARGRRVLLFGACRGGMLLLQELRNN